TFANRELDCALKNLSFSELTGEGRPKRSRTSRQVGTCQVLNERSGLCCHCHIDRSGHLCGSRRRKLFLLGLRLLRVVRRSLYATTHFSRDRFARLWFRWGRGMLKCRDRLIDLAELAVERLPRRA